MPATRRAPPSTRLGRGAAAARCGIQPRNSARVLRPHHRRRMPSLHLRFVEPGTALLRFLLDRAHRHPRRPDHRLLQPEPRHGVRPRRGGGRRRERGLRRVPHPHSRHRGRGQDRSERERRVRGQARQADPPGTAGTPRRRPHLHRQSARSGHRFGESDPHRAA